MVKGGGGGKSCSPPDSQEAERDRQEGAAQDTDGQDPLKAHPQ
jgi:hypothetical protein